MSIFQLIKCFICPVVAKKPNHRTLAWPIIYHSLQSGHNVGVACNTAPLWTYNTMILSRWTDGLCYSCMSRTALNVVIPTCLSSILQLPRDNSLPTYIFDLFPIFKWLEFHLWPLTSEVVLLLTTHVSDLKWWFVHIMLCFLLAYCQEIRGKAAIMPQQCQSHWHQLCLENDTCHR